MQSLFSSQTNKHCTEINVGNWQIQSRSMRLNVVGITLNNTINQSVGLLNILTRLSRSKVW